MTPIEAYDLLVQITARTRLTRDGHEQVKVALMTLRPLVEQMQQPLREQMQKLVPANGQSTE